MNHIIFNQGGQMKNAARKLKRRIVQSVIMLVSILSVCAVFFSFETYGQEKEQSVAAQTVKSGDESHGRAIWGFIAAAVAFGLGAIGAGMAIANVGAAAMGAVAEKPEIAGQALIFVALAEGLVVFGFIMGLLILGKV